MKVEALAKRSSISKKKSRSLSFHEICNELGCSLSLFLYEIIYQKNILVLFHVRIGPALATWFLTGLLSLSLVWLLSLKLEPARQCSSSSLQHFQPALDFMLAPHPRTLFCRIKLAMNLHLLERGTFLQIEPPRLIV